VSRSAAGAPCLVRPLVLDAFISDAVPANLLTREAMAIEDGRCRRSEARL
jgi:hypothetical protein